MAAVFGRGCTSHLSLFVPLADAGGKHRRRSKPSRASTIVVTSPRVFAKFSSICHLLSSLSNGGNALKRSVSGGGMWNDGKVARTTDVRTRALLTTDHETFIRESAALEPSPLLPTLLQVLQAQGQELAAPDDRRGMIPLAIPLTRNLESGDYTALLRWPTPPKGLEMPVIRVSNSSGVSLLAKTIEDYIHRALVEEDARLGQEDFRKVAEAAGEEGAGIYTKGSFLASKLPKLDVYLMKMVGKFPDVFENLALAHLSRGDTVSALVTGEYYSRPEHFAGFGRPFVFNSEILKKVGRPSEARDAARIAMKSPWWTLGAPFNEVAETAGHGDAQVEFVREKVSDVGREEDLKKGKAPAQVALDQAAFLLDLASTDGAWDSTRQHLASLYREGGYDDVANFVLSGPQ